MFKKKIQILKNKKNKKKKNYKKKYLKKIINQKNNNKKDQKMINNCNNKNQKNKYWAKIYLKTRKMKILLRKKSKFQISKKMGKNNLVIQKMLQMKINNYKEYQMLKNLYKI